MLRPVTCPHCGSTFRPDVSVDSARDAYTAMVIEGMPVREYARSRGMAASTAMLYRRCGIAIHVVGVEPDSPLFKQLVDGAIANRAAVAKELQRPGATPRSVQRVVNEHGGRTRPQIA
jgi:hypothetical protein